MNFEINFPKPNDLFITCIDSLIHSPTYEPAADGQRPRPATRSCAQRSVARVAACEKSAPDSPEATQTAARFERKRKFDVEGHEIT